MRIGITLICCSFITIGAGLQAGERTVRNDTGSTITVEITPLAPRAAVESAGPGLPTRGNPSSAKPIRVTIEPGIEQKISYAGPMAAQQITVSTQGGAGAIYVGARDRAMMLNSWIIARDKDGKPFIQLP